MIPIPATDAAALGAPWPDGLDQVAVTGVSIDSRSVEPGDLFVALAGSRVDGRIFIPAAFEAGASAALAERDGDVTLDRVIAVGDVVTAFGHVARMVRAFLGPAVAVGGSAGKTTTKEIRRFPPAGCGITESFNNHRGPLTICSVDTDTEALIAEIEPTTPRSLLAAREADPCDRDGHRSHTWRGSTRSSVLDEEMDLVRALPPGGVAFINADCEIDRVPVARASFASVSAPRDHSRRSAPRGGRRRLAVRLDPELVDERPPHLQVLQTACFSRRGEAPGRPG
jgi:UDP-N-acetylmuramoyl-tripeptide--D-alanyl-D-alanine ligase